MCGTLRGVVPWQTVGLAPQDVQGQHGLVTYVVYQAETDVCNATIGRADTMDNLGTAAADTISFALIDHGDNGLGAVNRRSFQKIKMLLTWMRWRPKKKLVLRRKRYGQRSARSQPCMPA